MVTSSLTAEEVMYLIHHVFLPPKVPQEDDSDVAFDAALVNTVVDCLRKFNNLVNASILITPIASAISSLKTNSTSRRTISEEKLTNALKKLCTQDGTILLHVQAQNAGVMISKQAGSVHFEAFELSPENEAVITTKGRLRRLFPGPSLSVRMPDFEDPSFQATTVRAFAKMSDQVAVNTKKQAWKTGAMHDEDRDTTHPKIITELFMGFLSSFGDVEEVNRIWKNTREEVFWDSSLLPWRRSPLWLLIRVAMQLMFSRSKCTAELYKTFMVFFMAHILEISQSRKIHSDLLYAMNAKLARRLLKLTSPVDGTALEYVQRVMQNSSALLNQRWGNIRELDGGKVANLKELNPAQDLLVTLPKLDAYINLMAQRNAHRSSQEFHPEPNLRTFQSTELPEVPRSSAPAYRAYNIYALEDWVACHLTPWIELHKGNQDTCKRLSEVLQQYYTVASTLYSGNVEGISTMILTIFELWVACDKSATHICKILLDYRHGISLGPLESLILPHKSQMERLGQVENYLSGRQSRARLPAQGVFQEFGRRDCFSVTYFSQSKMHRDLLEDIENRANDAREKKKDELRIKKKQFNDLMQLYDQGECEEIEVVVDTYNDFREWQHKPQCMRCTYKKHAEALSIRVHEWPLPSNLLEAQSTAFELRLPSFFGHWRDTTVFLLLEVMKNKYATTARPRATYHLKKYQGLSAFFTPFNSEQRIGLLSEVKPHEATHRRDKTIEKTEEDEVCVPNGLRYSYFDRFLDCFVDYGIFCSSESVSTACTYKLPHRSSSLQNFLARPASMRSGPPPNAVIASQADCPDLFSLEEYKALSSIPLGYRIQWQNILLQLAVPSVDFKKVETCLVILQSIYQAGPPATQVGSFRAGHEVVMDTEFSQKLLTVLHDALQRVKENWESSQALCTFVFLATRLLSLNPSERIRRGCLAFLDNARAVAFGWVTLLGEKAHRATDDNQRIEFRFKAGETALICAESFNISAEYPHSPLMYPEHASIFIQCSIVIQEGKTALSNSSDPVVSILLRRWMDISYRSYRVLARQVVVEKSTCLDDAIKQSWSAYEQGDGWKFVSNEVDYWLVSQVASQDKTEPNLCVHFNLLTGELLVNGLPLARLPSEYENHPTYAALFGRSTLEVMPTRHKGMHFSGKKHYAGFTLHFGLHPLDSFSSSDDLIVQAVIGEAKYEILPSRLLEADFPSDFVNNFVHWYDFKNNILEFRPRKDAWCISPHNWRLKRVGKSWQLSKEGVVLVAIGSQTSKLLSSILSTLEDPLRIHLMFNFSASLLEIDLPKYQLGFFHEPGSSVLKSKQFRGMYVDPVQTLGTLVGLENKLVLKHEKSEKRLVLVPEGEVRYQYSSGHVKVSIAKDSAQKAHVYHLDDQLGRLIDNESLQSKLFLSYLHALTSFCLPDPLLHRTGTEQALSILSSAAVKSFNRLAEENIEILGRIAELTPRRCYYPANLRNMQTVQWDRALGFLAQHGGFYEVVTSIFKETNASKVFYPESNLDLPQINQEEDLLQRDNLRGATFRVSGFGAEDHSVKHDKPYGARDQAYDSTGGHRAFIMSNLIYHRRTTLHYKFPRNFESDRILWKFISRTDQIFDPDHPLSTSELRYDGKFLQNPDTFISQYWRVLHRTAPQLVTENRFGVMMFLATLAFGKDANMDVLSTVASFFTIPSLSQLTLPPSNGDLHLSLGSDTNGHELNNLAQKAYRPFHSCPEARLVIRSGESQRQFHSRRQRQFQSNQAKSGNVLKTHVESQWPCEVPLAPPESSAANLNVYIDVTKYMRDVQLKFKSWYDNFQFSQFVDNIGNNLQRQPIRKIDSPSTQFNPPAWNIMRGPGFISNRNILDNSAPLLQPHQTRDLSELLCPIDGEGIRASRLVDFIHGLEGHVESSYERSYVDDLQRSLVSLQRRKNQFLLRSDGVDVKTVLANHLSECKNRADKIYGDIFAALTSPKKTSSGQQKLGISMANGVNQFPRISPTFVLQQLARCRWRKLTNEWKYCVVQYGLALSHLQRAERLVGLSGNKADLVKELQNPGHTNWDPLQHPESLLLEVESGIMIREVQEDIASQMRDPSAGENSVMQLNMGEGKSSVIVPMVAVALADGSRLVRVIVAKPQSKQMFQMMVSKLGGMLDRRVYQMPFSRALKLGEDEANAIRNMYNQCMLEGGILLVQPEHILSFKLMGIESLISENDRVGRSLLDTQEFLDTSSRDIVDESDENFSVKFELIYTMGMQRPIELSPERWICIQQVLSLVKLFIPSVKQELPFAMDVHEHSLGGFPRTRILTPDAQHQLMSRVAGRICLSGLDGFPIARQPGAIRQAVYRYIMEPNLTADEIAQVESQDSTAFWSTSTSSILLLLRGLIAGGVLSFAFGQKRWRVNYGPDANRKPSTKLSVPYRAKDSPSPRSEFSHPDVVIVLTSLSYYYGGLANEDLFLAFTHLLKSDQANVEYQEWVKSAPELEPSFHSLVGINLKDEFQCETELFPPLRYSKGAIDYFLAHIVFPKEMKEFPHKLSASGWDIGQIKSHPTTGFSGTNDSKTVLPLSVQHLDLNEQNHTNALVLEYLLQPENTVTLLPPRSTTSASDADILLEIVTNMSPEIQVILDVGAQILELDNLQVATQWLQMKLGDVKAQAVVFFNDNDELSVVDRNGNVDPLQTSSFAKQLDVCLIFLDEAHTRGTDLRLPAHYRAAVTLGANLTKDRLVQACMRMRKLGTGQSVVFCVPEEIKTKILGRKTTKGKKVIEVADVLSWAISETCMDIRRSMPLWAAQGQRFEQQKKLWNQARTHNGFAMSKGHADKFLEVESQSLEDRYQPRSGIEVGKFIKAGKNKNLNLILDRCQKFHNLEFNSATLQEEQERELAPEIEQEKQVEKPPPATPAKHSIQPGLLQLVRTGVVMPSPQTYFPAFHTLKNTSAASHLDVLQFPPGLYVSADFARTIQVTGASYISDKYQRPVQWILTGVESVFGSSTVAFMIVISPYEAQELLPEISKSYYIALHLYAPRPSLNFPSLDQLDLYTVTAQSNKRLLPRDLIIQLNLFAGQLYFSSFEEYVETCDFLGLAWDKTGDDSIVAADGFIIHGGSGMVGSTFTESPVRFMKVLMTTIRRNCESIDKTHMGRILDGSLLLPEEFDQGDEDEMDETQ